jgi:DNA-binding SARP family transcriptional activator/tetratricopeptide (TPR) repeat protein
MIRLRSLGALDLRDSNGLELRAILAQPRRLALLGYLAVTSPQGLQRRDRLLGLFWRDHDRQRARASLNRAVHFLRRVLGDGVIESHRDEVGLDVTRFSCDAAELELAFDAKRYQEVSDLYRGDLLPGFFVSDAPGFEEWLEIERARLRERASAAAWVLAGQEEAKGQLALAARFAARGVELAPFGEVGLRRLLTLLDRAGDRSGAVHAYDRFVQEMAAELDVTPSPETRSLIDAIRARTRSTASRPIVGVDESPSQPAAPSAEERRLVSGSETPGPLAASPRRRSRVGMLAGIAAFALLATTLIATRPDPTIDPERIDVEPFANRSGDPVIDLVATASTERAIGGLTQAGLFRRVVPLSRTEGRRWPLRWSGLTERGAHPNRDRGAITISGTVNRTNGELSIEARLTNRMGLGSTWVVSSKPIVHDGSERATAELAELIERVIGGAAALRNPYTAMFLPVASAPPTFEAYQEYVQGITQLQAREIADAQRHFRLAMAHDSTFTWSMVEEAMSAFHSVVSSPSEHTDSVLDALTRIRTRIPPLQRHVLDHLRAVRVEDWRGSYQAICRAAALAPLRFAYRCAIAASHVNRPRATIQALTANPAVDSLYRRDAQNYWNVLTLAYHQLGEHRNELATARKAREYRPDSPSALAQEVRALAALGNIEAVRVNLDTLQGLATERWFTPAEAMLQTAQELRAHGHPREADAIAAHAIEWYHARPAEERATEARRYQLGRTLYFRGNWTAADSVFRALAAEFPGNEEYVGFLGVTAARRNDRRIAESFAAKLATLEHQLPLPGQTSIVWRAKIALLLGDRTTAISLFRDAYGPDGTMELHPDIDIESIRDYPPFREFIKPKV